jgi:hypothetical protein
LRNSPIVEPQLYNAIALILRSQLHSFEKKKPP